MVRNALKIRNDGTVAMQLIVGVIDVGAINMAQRMLGEVIKEKQSPLSVEEVVRLFRSDKVSVIPFRPKGGQIIAFQPKSPAEKEDWKADGHRWTNASSKKLPRKDPIFKKAYFYAKGEDGKAINEFRKDVYFPIDNPENIAIIHYIGDDQMSVTGKHGNSLKQTKLFFRTKPSVLKRIAEEVEENVPHKVYKKMVTEPPEQPEQVGLKSVLL